MCWPHAPLTLLGVELTPHRRAGRQERHCADGHEDGGGEKMERKERTGGQLLEGPTHDERGSGEEHQGSSEKLGCISH